MASALGAVQNSHQLELCASVSQCTCVLQVCARVPYGVELMGSGKQS